MGEGAVLLLSRGESPGKATHCSSTRCSLSKMVARASFGSTARSATGRFTLLFCLTGYTQSASCAPQRSHVGMTRLHRT